MPHRPANPFGFWLDCQTVIARRMALFAQGGTKAQAESLRMVTEKMQAAARAQAMLLRGRSSRQVMAMVARKVRANKKRL